MSFIFTFSKCEVCTLIIDHKEVTSALLEMVWLVWGVQLGQVFPKKIHFSSDEPRQGNVFKLVHPEEHFRKCVVSVWAEKVKTTASCDYFFSVSKSSGWCPLLSCHHRLTLSMRGCEGNLSMFSSRKTQLGRQVMQIASEQTCLAVKLEGDNA